MTRKLRAEPLGAVIEHARGRDEPQLRAKQTDILFTVETLIDTLQHAPLVSSHEVALDVDDRDTLLDVLREWVTMPTVGGRKPKSEQDKADAAEAKTYWREQQMMARQSMSASAANEIATRRLGERFPRYKNKSIKKIVDMMQRRDLPDA